MNNSFFNKTEGLIKKYHLDAFKDVAIFMIILLVFHVLWKIFIGDLFEVAAISNSAYALAKEVFVESKWIVRNLGFDVTPFDHLTINGSLHKNVFYYAENNGYVSVNRSCSGLKQFYQWFFLMVLYPGSWKNKIWFIPMGLIIIHVVNIFRIVTMAWVTINLAQHWDFIHDYVLRPFFYVVMFFLWVWWNEKFYMKRKRMQASS